MHKDEVNYRDLAMQQLTTEQQDFILNIMRRGKKTAWLNVMAEIKGIVIDPEDDEETITRKIGGWILEHFDDLGTRDGKCECGQSIRYVYHVNHVESKDSLILGSTCIESYTGLDAKTVESVIKGMRAIDQERDEILGKVISGWRIPVEIPVGMELPLDIEQHLKMELPLLDRQVAKMKKLIIKYQRGNWQPQSLLKKVNPEKGIEQPEFDLFDQEEESSVSLGMRTMMAAQTRKHSGQSRSVPNVSSIPVEWKGIIDNAVLQAKESGRQKVTALMMANHVAKMLGYEQDLLSTGKPRTYFLVARYMDKHTALEVIESSLENITYRLV